MIAFVPLFVAAFIAGGATVFYWDGRRYDQRERYTLYSLRCDEPQVVDHAERAVSAQMRYRWIVWQEGADRENDTPLMLGNAPTDPDGHRAANLWIAEQQERFDGVRMNLTGPLEMNR